jgi:hypothetical protein
MDQIERKREMKNFESYSSVRPWLVVALASVMAVGCGGGGSSDLLPAAVALHSSQSGGNSGNNTSNGNSGQSGGNSSEHSGNSSEHSGNSSEHSGNSSAHDGNGHDGSSESSGGDDHGSSGGGGTGGGGTPQVPGVLGTASTFAILSKSGITDVAASVITGDVGASPITGAAIGLSCPEVIGTIYSVDAAGPLPCEVINAALLTTAVADMQTLYTDLAGRTLPDFTDLGAGEIGGLTLAPGLYKWGTGVSISTNVTLSGGPNDVWIFQIAGTLTQASATTVTLTGGALAKNVFWQSAGAVAIGTTAHLEGIVLGQTLIAVNTGASVNGRLLAQTAVTLQKNVVTQPAP